MRIIPVVLILLFAFLGACQRDPLEIDESNADAPKPSYLALTDTVRWFLSTDEGCAPRIEFLKDLSDSLALYGVHAEPLPGQEYRFGFNGEEYVDWMRCKWENEAAYLHDDSLLLGESFQILETYQGMDEDSLEIEILGCNSYLESLTELPCRVLAFPRHTHDMRDMLYLRDQGFLAARNGLPGPMPWGSFLAEDEPCAWGSVSLFETPINLSCAELQAVDPDSMASWLAGTYQDEWLAGHRWVQLYTHTDDPSVTGTAVLDTLHLGAFLDALLATGEFWIAPVGEIASFVRETHQASDPGGLVWRNGECSDQPWNGHVCAFSFSTDDGFLANLHAYRHCFADRGLSYTAFLNRHKIEHAESWMESPYMDPDEVSILSESGVEIGNHGANHRCLLRPEALQLRLDRPAGEVTLDIRSEGGRKVLRLWEVNATGVP